MVELVNFLEVLSSPPDVEERLGQAIVRLRIRAQRLVGDGAVEDSNWKVVKGVSAALALPSRKGR